MTDPITPQDPVKGVMDQISQVDSSDPSHPVSLVIPEYFNVEDFAVAGGMIVHPETGEAIPQIFLTLKYLDHDDKLIEITFALPAWNAMKVGVMTNSVTMSTMETYTDVIAESMSKDTPPTSRKPSAYL